jgi:hypothetical protein
MRTVALWLAVSTVISRASMLIPSNDEAATGAAWIVAAASAATAIIPARTATPRDEALGTRGRSANKTGIVLDGELRPTSEDEPRTVHPPGRSCRCLGLHATAPSARRPCRARSGPVLARVRPFS